MPVDPYIARGITPIGANIPETAGMLQNLYAVQDRTNSMNMAAQAKQGELQLAQSKEKELRDAQEAYAMAAAAMEDPSRRPMLSARIAQETGSPPPDLSDDRVMRAVFSEAAIRAGKTPQSAPQPPTSFREFQLAQDNPEYAASLAESRKNKGVNVTIPITMPKEVSKGAETYYGGKGASLLDVENAGLEASEQLKVVDALMEHPAVTGPTQDTRAALTSFFADFGVPIADWRIDQIGNLASYKAIVKEQVLKEMQKQKGPQTESDMRMISETWASTRNIPEGNQFLLRYKRALLERQAIRGQIVNQMMNETGGDSRQVTTQLFRYNYETPLVGKNPTSGRVVFWNEYRDARLGQGLTEEAALAEWRGKYGR